MSVDNNLRFNFFESIVFMLVNWIAFQNCQYFKQGTGNDLELQPIIDF